MVPDASIIILTKNAGHRFEEVLGGVESQAFPGEVEVVVVDSGSTDGTLQRARSFGANIYEIDPDEFHHSRTRNYGAQRARGDTIVYLTHDAVPRDDQWLGELVNPVLHGSAAAAYGRQVAYPDAKPMDEFFYSYFYPDERDVLTPEETENERRFFLDNVFVSDVSSAIDRSVWEQFPFRDSVAMSEDKDFALRVLQNGKKIVYEPAATVYHSHDYDILSQFRRRYRDGQAYANIAREGDGTFISEGIDYVASELRYLVSNGHAHWVPYAVAYDFAHFLGFESGKRLGQIREGASQA